MKGYVYSHNPHSEGAKELARALGIKRVKHGIGSKFRGGRGKVVINWGAGTIPDQVAACEKVYNVPEAIRKASNKLKSFELFEEAGVCIPQFFKTEEDARDYLQENPQSSLVCRTVLNGHSGAGIVIITADSDWVAAPLYTAYVKKSQEYRYHVFAGQVVDIQRKARRREVPDDQVNWQVRNLDGGFIFAREGVVESEDASQNAIMAVAALGLDFGAVDLIYNERENKYYVLEVNTAPGLAGSTLEGYSRRFQEVLG
jgi:glutathione synthase/RimK-type ligase-like ATP-grasp enzyme